MTQTDLTKQKYLFGITVTIEKKYRYSSVRSYIEKKRIFGTGFLNIISIHRQITQKQNPLL